MPPGWIHRAHDLIIFGDIYTRIHKWKDERPGGRHRRWRHKWYNEFGKTWDFQNPFPPRFIKQYRRFLAKVGPGLAEVRQADILHDYWDRFWDTLNLHERENIGAAFLFWIMEPELLLRKADVDVFGEKVRRKIHGREVWERIPRLNEKYMQLRRSIWSRLSVKGGAKSPRERSLTARSESSHV